MTVRCHSCGATTDIEGSFVGTRNVFGIKKNHYCPTCWMNRHDSALKISLIIYGVIAIVGIGSVLYNPKGSFGWTVLNLFLICVISLFMIIPHELGHACTAKLLGFQVLKIILGMGKTLCSFRLLGISWDIKQIPLGGLTQLLYNSSRFYRTKRFLIGISGPLVNLSFLLFALRLHGEFFKIEGVQLYPTTCFLIANFFILGVNLIPRTITTAQGRLPNDGLSLLKIPFMSASRIQQELSLCVAFEALEQRRRRQFDKAQQTIEKGLVVNPENEILLSVLGVVLLDLGELYRAKDIFSKLIQQTKMDKNQKAIYFNNLAYADILIGEQNFMQEADDYSAQAYEDDQQNPAIKGTRGMVLVELGNFDEGIALLKEALSSSDDPNDKSINAAYIAIGEKRRGNDLLAQGYLNTATQLAPNCRLLRRAHDEIQSR